MKPKYVLSECVKRISASPWKSLKGTKGFSLISTIVAMSLSSILLLFLSQILVNIQSSGKTIRVHESIDIIRKQLLDISLKDNEASGL